MNLILNTQLPVLNYLIIYHPLTHLLFLLGVKVTFGPDMEFLEFHMCKPPPVEAVAAVSAAVRKNAMYSTTF